MLATTTPPERQLPPPTEGRWYAIGQWTRNHRIAWLMFYAHTDPDIPPTDAETQARLADADRGPYLEKVYLIYATDHGEAQRVYRRQYSGRAVLQTQGSQAVVSNPAA